MPQDLGFSSLHRLLSVARLADAPGTNGERVAAVAAVARLLEAQGISLENLISRAMAPAPPPSDHHYRQPRQRQPCPRSPEWRQVAADCLRHPRELSEWESDFLGGLGRLPRLSPRQRAKLEQISDRVLGRRTET